MVLGIGRGDSAVQRIGKDLYPLAAFRRYLDELQGYLRGASVKRGDFDSRLEWHRTVDQPKVPVQIAATGPKVIELAAQRAEAEKEMDRAKERAREQARREAEQLAEARSERHAELAGACKRLADQLKASAPDQFIVRTGWSTSREEFIAKISTRQLSPARTLFIELDRDDDEVLARWTTDVGNTIELWRLLEVTTEMLGEMVLQIADQELWDDATAPPPYPTRG